MESTSFDDSEFVTEVVQTGTVAEQRNFLPSSTLNPQNTIVPLPPPLFSNFARIIKVVLDEKRNVRLILQPNSTFQEFVDLISSEAKSAKKCVGFKYQEGADVYDVGTAYAFEIFVWSKINVVTPEFEQQTVSSAKAKSNNKRKLPEIISQSGENSPSGSSNGSESPSKKPRRRETILVC